MAKFRLSVDQVDAVQWEKHGDDARVIRPRGSQIDVVDGKALGYIDGRIVRSGDWIVSGAGAQAMVIPAEYFSAFFSEVVD